MYPRLFTIPKFLGIGPLTLHTYGVLMATALLVALWVAARQARRAGLDPARVTDLGIYALIAGLVGGKLALLLIDWRTYLERPRELLALLQSAGVFYGGFVLALVLTLWYVRRARLPLWPTLDVLAPAVAIGQAIGRVGCFFAGCCYGRPWTGPWAVTFRDVYATRQVGTPVDIPLHPTQLYESAGTLLLFLALIWLAPRKKFHGMVILTYAAGYASLRFVIEFYRGDAIRGSLFHGALSTSQFVALLVLIGCVALLPYLLKRQRIAAAASKSSDA
jgi:phosphatidylglycerol:prolipoprotein diacylglycerol transferase